jgi:hypothetical protein
MFLTPRRWVAALLLPAAAHAQPLLSFDDPAGDDLGDGTLVYPRDATIERGDLDLRQLRLVDDGGQLRIEVSFARPIRSPADVGSGQGGNESLALFARRGFYAFNVDLYLDLDRVAGSGSSTGLPGRRVRFDAPFAWDKAIVLTPRPELMRRQLGDALADAAPAPEVAATLERSVHFATDVRVRGRTVSLAVPREFLSPEAVRSASLVAIVTAAKLNIEADLGRLGGVGRSRALERLALGAEQPQSGRPASGLGYRSDRPPATAVVDLLDPSGAAQARQLTEGVLLAVSGDAPGTPSAGVTAQPAAAAAETAAAAPVAPSASGGSGSWFSRALEALGGLFGAGAASAAGGATAPAVAVPASPVAIPAGTPAAALPAAAASPAAAPGASPVPAATTAPARAAPAATAPATAAPTTAAPTTAAPTMAAPATTAPGTATPPPAAAAGAPRPAARPPRDAAFYEEQEQRLRALQRLRERNLITEEEYQRKRKEIVDAL